MSLSDAQNMADSDTCIVCLGHLKNEFRTTTQIEHLSSDVPLGAHPVSASPEHEEETPGMIARLPCGHHVHDECVKPWVERTNSCPICRKIFNSVELCPSIGAPIVSTYTVQDKVQEAEIDPSMLIDEDSDEESEDFEPCPICGDDGDVLLICDGCEVGWHTFCVGLDSVPTGDWYCENCEGQRPIEPCLSESTAGSNRTPSRTHRSNGRRNRLVRRNQDPEGSWARVWQTVMDRLDLDLDFPFEDNQIPQPSYNQSSQQRGFHQWERRVQVAERQGGGNRFRDTASTILESRSARGKSREKQNQPVPESQEEVRAWNAFEKAKEMEVPNQNKRKRKSATSSPTEAGPSNEQERKLKRPRTRRAPDNSATTTAVQPASTIRRRPSANLSSVRRTSRTPQESARSGPTFLQSLLSEVESSATPDDNRGRFRVQTNGPSSAVDHSSPCMSSPSASPTNSNHASPRALSATPPPYPTRPCSPVPLSSKVEPVFPAPEFSPTCSPVSASSRLHPYVEPRSCRQHSSRSSSAVKEPSPTISPQRSRETSPTGTIMSLSAKEDIQKMVIAALRPHYHTKRISKDQYTDINRNVSRKLYDKFGNAANLDPETKRGWGQVATDMVSKAVQSLTSAS